MDQEKLNRILDDHRKWLDPLETGGTRANLRGANLCWANLYGANLREADLYGADLYGADLRGADLYGANLYGANLYEADLYGADLYGADLRGANLRGANLREANLPAFGIPEEGVLIVWKSVEKGLAKIKVPDGAKRTGSLIGRKCRAEYVETLAIYMPDGKEIDESPGTRDSDIIYRVGTITYPDRYDNDPRLECSHGIHFFLTRAEAEAW